MEISINYLAVLVAAIAAMVIGFVWYGVLFKNQWIALTGCSPEDMEQMKMSANKSYVLQFIASLVMAGVLSYLVDLRVIYTLVSSPDFSSLKIGLCTGFWAWLGFVVPVTLGSVLWENKPWKLWFISGSGYLVTLLVMGVIIALWQ